MARLSPLVALMGLTLAPGLVGALGDSAETDPDGYPAACTVTGYLYLPHNMVGQNKTFELDWHWCQLRCKHTAGCLYFGYWPDKGCHLQGVTYDVYGTQLDVTLDKAICFDESTDCAGTKIISGPDDCTDPSKYPQVSGDVTPVALPTSTMMPEPTTVTFTTYTETTVTFTTPEPPTTVTFTTPEPPVMPVALPVVPVMPTVPATPEPPAVVLPVVVPITSLPGAKDINSAADRGEVGSETEAPKEGGGMPIWGWIVGLLLLCLAVGGVMYATGMTDAFCVEKRRKKKKKVAQEDSSLLAEEGEGGEAEVISTQQQPVPMYQQAPAYAQSQPAPMYQAGAVPQQMPQYNSGQYPMPQQMQQQQPQYYAQ